VEVNENYICEWGDEWSEALKGCEFSLCNEFIHSFVLFKKRKKKKEKDVNFSCGVVQDWSRVQRKKITHMKGKEYNEPIKRI